MKYYTATIIKDAKSSEERRYRNILANSGQIMESGEVRDLANLYVMGRDGKLIAVKDLNKNPDKQTEDYTSQHFPLCHEFELLFQHNIYHQLRFEFQ